MMKRRQILGAILLTVGLIALVYNIYCLYLFIAINDLFEFSSPSYRGLFTIIVFSSFSLLLVIYGFRLRRNN